MFSSVILHFLIVHSDNEILLSPSTDRPFSLLANKCHCLLIVKKCSLANAGHSMMEKSIPVPVLAALIRDAAKPESMLSRCLFGQVQRGNVLQQLCLQHRSEKTRCNFENSNFYLFWLSHHRHPKNSQLVQLKECWNLNSVDISFFWNLTSREKNLPSIGKWSNLTES